MKKVNEIFYSIQGEGFYSGTPAIFIRFSGCNLKCPFCDTRHEEGTLMTDEAIVATVIRYPARMVILTGGEPSLWIDNNLIRLLHQAGKYVCIETNGTHPLPADIDWVTCSPKEGAPVCLDKVNEIKVVYTGQDIYKYGQMKANFYYLQPCSGKNIKDVINFIMMNPQWKLSLQTQKILNLQ